MAAGSKSTTIEAVKYVQDTTDRYMDEAVAINRAYMATWASFAQSSWRTSFELQNAAMQATRAMVEATTQANLTWFDQGVEAVRKAQDTAAKIVTSGIEMAESAMPKAQA